MQVAKFLMDVHYSDYRSEDLNGNGVFNDGVHTPYLNEAIRRYRLTIVLVTQLDEDVTEDLDRDGFFDQPARVYTYVEAVMHTPIEVDRMDVALDATVTITGTALLIDSPPDRIAHSHSSDPQQSTLARCRPVQFRDDPNIRLPI